MSCDSIVDGPFMIRKGRHNVTEDWEPKNSDNKYRGMVTLKRFSQFYKYNIG
jgi:penicillin-binding protein 1A